MGETIRAFVAIELTDAVRHALAAVGEELRRARIDGLRLVRPEGIHLTLKFLGDVEHDQISAIESGIALAARGHPRFSLVLGQPGAFPNTPRARVLWVDMRGDVEPLRALQGRIEDTLEPLGFAKERRDFSPHLTVARLKDTASRTERSRAVEALMSATLDTPEAIGVTTVSLMRSRLHPDGATYERIASIPLDTATSA